MKILVLSLLVSLSVIASEKTEICNVVKSGTSAFSSGRLYVGCSKVGYWDFISLDSLLNKAKKYKKAGLCTEIKYYNKVDFSKKCRIYYFP